MEFEAKRKGIMLDRSKRRWHFTAQTVQGGGKLRFKSLLVPIDFSETSVRALDYAVALVAQFSSRLRLLHVLEHSSVFKSLDPAFANWDSRAKETAKIRLAELVDEKVDKLTCVNCNVRFGRAYLTICKIAREQKADLIVIGTHGFTGLKHFFLGSTAERVIRHSPCSVLAVRKPTSRNAKAILKPKSILVPTDFSEPAEQTLNAAVELAKQYQAKIHLLYVIPMRYAVGDYDAVDYVMLAAKEKTIGRKRLAEIRKRLLAKKVSVGAQIKQGRPAVEINEAAAELDCDLIVISTHGRTGWSRITLGSTTEEVVRHSTCPVLVVKN